MRKLIFLFTLLVMAMTAGAQQRPNNNDRQQWMAEMQQYKHDFLTRELSLTDDQKDGFFTVYDKMDYELREAEAQVRQLERLVRRKGEAATDEELTTATDAAFALPARQYEITMKYYPQFKSTLSAQQLFKLKGAERRFTQELMEHRPGNNGNGNGKAAGQQPKGRRK